jgi:hypothetical protein
LPRDKWPELSSRIQEIISGQQNFFKNSKLDFLKGREKEALK